MDCDLVGPPSWADRSNAKWRAIAELGKRKKKDWLGLKAALASNEDTGRRLKKTKPNGKPEWLECHRARLAKKRAR
ncbi:hypothetical protein D9615_002693 [Tricholomella constricta]|uniref:Uncharacterized protein n=1 Tax=Tricholomella constricta TaxID=117010 RepID=A0A8H5MA07_9AGAR|nr:hypothetical protein D9615_002693 [Tricholomella constricta]